MNLPIDHSTTLGSEDFIYTLKFKNVFYLEFSLFIYQNRRHHKPGVQIEALHSFGASIAVFCAATGYTILNLSHFLWQAGVTLVTHYVILMRRKPTLFDYGLC